MKVWFVPDNEFRSVAVPLPEVLKFRAPVDNRVDVYDLLRKSNGALTYVKRGAN